MDLASLKTKDITTKLKKCCEILGVTVTEHPNIGSKHPIYDYKAWLIYVTGNLMDAINNIKDENFLLSKACHQGPDGCCAHWWSVNESFPYPDETCRTCMNFSKQDYEKALEVYNG